MARRAEEILKRLNLVIDVTPVLSSYSIAIQQLVAIARVLDISSKILILDEPTSSLDESEVEQLFKVIRKLRDDGLAIIFITHFLDQTYQIADRITVLKNGELVGEYKTEKLPKLDLIARMLGKELSEFSYAADKDQRKRAHANMGKDSEKPAHREGPRPPRLHCALRSQPRRRGSARIGRAAGFRQDGDGAAHFRHRRSQPGRNTGQGEEDRHQFAAKRHDGRDRLLLGGQEERRHLRGAHGPGKHRPGPAGQDGVFKYITPRKQLEIADEMIKSLGIVTPNANSRAGQLSGGNQQKVMLARWLATHPIVLILDEPTRGIDVGAKLEIMELILNLSKQGMGLIFISSEFEEVVRCSSRIAVLKDKAKIAELDGEQMNENSIMRTIAGGN